MSTFADVRDPAHKDTSNGERRVPPGISRDEAVTRREARTVTRREARTVTRWEGRTVTRSEYEGVAESGAAGRHVLDDSGHGPEAADDQGS
jgi:hypothetical protein